MRIPIGFYPSVGFLLAIGVAPLAHAAANIQMLPPTDFISGAPCAGANGGVLQWDGASSIKCVPGFMGLADGHVGIGTTNPAETLDVEGDGVVRAQVGSTTAGAANAAYFVANRDNAATSYAGYEWNTGGVNTWALNLPSGSIDLRFFDSTVNPGAERMRIQAGTGNVGIATETPQTTLDVNGSIRAGSTGVATGSACSPEGSMAYDLNTHKPVYCSNSLVWTDMASNGFSSCTTVSAGPRIPSATASCSTGYTMTGGGCSTSGGVGNSYPNSRTSWTCVATGSVNAEAYAICCH